MIRLPNGHEFDWCVSSGALGFDGLGWWWERPLYWAGIIDPAPFVVVAKTVTAAPRRGNLRMRSPWTCVRLLPSGGTVNAVGLTNPGLVRWLARDLPRAWRHGICPAASVKPDSPAEAAGMAVALRTVSTRLPFVEVNLSCPNVHHVPDNIPSMLRALRLTGAPIIFKLSADQITSEFLAAVDPLVDGYHAINTVPWDVLYPGRRSPIEGYAHGLKGGVSGPPIRAIALESVRRLRDLTERPIVGGGGIFSTDDTRDMRAAGADAVAFGTLFLRRPWAPNRIVAESCNSVASPTRA